MPELPEVETIARNLRAGKDGQPALVGLSIQSAQLLWPRTLATPPQAEFHRRITGQVIEQIGRRGKFLRFDLSRDVMFIHLRMSGDLRVKPKGIPQGHHDRLVYHLSNDWQLIFEDARKFGRVWLTQDPLSVVGHLGLEPFWDEFTADWLHQALLKRHRQIKPLLLDQTFVAGIGNIYADEALYLAQLHPLTLSDTLTLEQAVRLRQAIRTVLLKGIEHSGTSIDWVYRGGDFQNYLQVHLGEDQPCQRCGDLIVKTVVGQRGTYFCPTCQPLPGS
jgi:formamidopyrimidine-DNA glycosylase